MDVGEILERVGGWGRYQKVIYVFACLPSIVFAAITVSYSWLAFVMDHRCLVKDCEDVSNATYSAEFLKFTTPHDDAHTWSRCSVFKRNGSDGCQPADFSHQIDICSHWVYDTSVMENTLVSEFNLVCDKQTLRPMANSLYFAGMAVGSILSGIAADKFGRTVTLIVCIVLSVITSTATAYSPNILIFSILRFLVAACSYGFFSIPFMLSMEMTSINVRSYCGILINVFFAAGEALAGIIPLFVKKWKSLQLIYSLPSLFFFSYWFFLPESPRWLLAVNKPQKAEKVLRNIAKWNRKPFPEELVQQEMTDHQPQSSSEASESFLVAMKTPVLLIRAVILTLQWMVVSLVYYGITMVSTDFGGNIYLDFILSMVIEIPSYIFCALTINPLGRKLVIGGAFLLSGLGTIGAGFVTSHDMDWLKTVMAMAGKFGAASAFSLVFVYTAELYPNGIRGVGVGIASASGRIGAILAPFIADLGQGSSTLPLCIFGVSGLVAGAVTAFLPETSGHDLPANIGEAAAFGRNQPWLPVPCLVARRRHGQTEPAGDGCPTSSQKEAPAAGGGDLSGVDRTSETESVSPDTEPDAETVPVTI